MGPFRRGPSRVGLRGPSRVNEPRQSSCVGLGLGLSLGLGLGLSLSLGLGLKLGHEGPSLEDGA